MNPLAVITSRLRAIVKAAYNDTGFASSEGGHSQFSRANLRLWLPNTATDYGTLAGPLWSNSAVAACLQWIMRNLQQAPMRVQRMVDDQQEWQPDHPLTALLRHPNPYYNGNCLLAGTAISWFCEGNAYYFIDSDRIGRPQALWYVPHWLLEPARDDGSTEYITHYWFFPGHGQRQRIPVERVLHLRFGIDPLSPLRGMAPLAAVLREVYTDTEAVNYSASMLKNMGVVGALATPANDTVQFDPATFTELYRSKTRGDKRGEVLAYDVPITLQFPDVSPDKMALPVIEGLSSSRICAIFGVPEAVIGLASGMEQTKVGATMAELREVAWEECLLPHGGMIAEQIGARLLPLYGRDQTLSVALDTRAVRPLQPDLDAIHTRVRDDYKAGLIDRFEARQETKREARPEDKDVWAAGSQTPDPLADAQPPNPAGQPAPVPPPTQPKPGPAKRSAEPPAEWAARVTAELEALETLVAEPELVSGNGVGH